MQLITRESDYALQALICIALSKKSIVSVTEVVKKLKSPRPFTRKILQRLDKHNILTSRKGKKGGFSLARSPENIFFTDVVGTFQGDVALLNCFIKKKICPNRKSCCLRKRIGRLEDSVVKELKGITIASLLEEV